MRISHNNCVAEISHGISAYERNEMRYWYNGHKTLAPMAVKVVGVATPLRWTMRRSNVVTSQLDTLKNHRYVPELWISSTGSVGPDILDVTWHILMVCATSTSILTV